MSDNLLPHNDDPVDLVVVAFQRVPVPERPDDRAMFALLAGLQPGIHCPVPTTPRSNRGFFRRPAFQVAAMATILLTGGVWWLLNPPRSVALSQVIQTIERQKVVRYKIGVTVHDNRGSHNSVITSYCDFQTPRTREEHRWPNVNGEMGQLREVQIVDYTTWQFLTLDLKYNAARIGHYQIQQRLGQRNYSILDQMRYMQDDMDTTSEKSTLDGRDVLQYRLEKDGRTAVLWVNSSNKLPARVETTFRHQLGMFSRLVFTDFEWDLKGADQSELFGMKLPKGYTMVDDSADEKTEKAQKDLEGKWRALQVVLSGQDVPIESLKDFKLTIKGDEITIVQGPKTFKHALRFDPTGKSPMSIDILTLEGPNSVKDSPGIYTLEKDILRICYPNDPSARTKRPTELKTQEGDGLSLLVLERVN
jgi:uncharacterized protein (TIGR03067 family)